MENLVEYQLVKNNSSKQWIFEAQDIKLDDNWEGRLVVKKDFESEAVVDKVIDLDKDKNRFVAYLTPTEADIDTGDYILTVELKNDKLEPPYKKEIFQINLKILTPGI